MKIRSSRTNTADRASRRTNNLKSSILGIIIILVSFCSFVYPQASTPNNPLKDDLNYKIGVGDVLKVLVLKQDTLTQDKIRVGNEGSIRMPMLDEPIPAACQTEAELSAEIANRYKKYLLNPQVYVTVIEYNANPVAVVGSVIAPGRFQLQRPMRLLEILTYVNGPTLNAGQNVQIIHNSNFKRCGESQENTDPETDKSSQEDVIFLSLAEVMKGNEGANPFVEPGDIIRVTEAEIKQAYVIGNVRSPAIINLKEPMTLSRAIAQAGGFAQGAKMDKIKISRQAPNSLAKTEILVDLKNPKTNDLDILLQPNDVVEVPGPKPPGFFTSLLKGIIPTITRLPVGIIP